MLWFDGLPVMKICIGNWLAASPFVVIEAMPFVFYRNGHLSTAGRLMCNTNLGARGVEGCVESSSKWLLTTLWVIILIDDRFGYKDE